jgi:hypothetical protein
MDITTKCIYTTDLSYKRIDYNKKVLVSMKVINNDSIFYVTPSPPKYPENENNIIENLKYIVPAEDERKGNNLFTVFLTFTILENGSMTDISVFSIYVKEKYDRQIISVFKKYTKNWTPAKFNGRPVKYRKTLAWQVEYVKNIQPTTR